MTTDPVDPETVREQDRPAGVAPDVPGADAAEQRRDLLPQGDDDPSAAGRADVPEADAAEQARVVENPEEDRPR